LVALYLSAAPGTIRRHDRQAAYQAIMELAAREMPCGDRASRVVAEWLFRIFLRFHRNVPPHRRFYPHLSLRRIE
jgi:hypothetical protein